jgi:class 3 adenylate cyclase
LVGADHFVAVNADQILDQVASFLDDHGSAPAVPTVIVYDGPAAAIRDALVVLGGAHGRGTRFGLQIAEVPRTGPVVDGLGVQSAVRLAERAAPGQLLVSSTVRDLVADARLSFLRAGDGAYRAALPTPTVGRTS